MDVKRIIGAWLVLAGSGLMAQAETATRVVIVRGADGAEEYGAAFAKQVELWEAAAKAAGADTVVIGPEAGEQALERVGVDASARRAAVVAVHVAALGVHARPSRGR